MSRSLLLLVLITFFFVIPANSQVADETGMVPGDIILGNMNTFPGHAGIYLGKWEKLPKDLQDRHHGVYEKLLNRTSDPGLNESFLVIDSDGGRGTRVAVFVEQFTDYYIKGGSLNLPGARIWESKLGAAVQWPGLAPGDARRWRIIDEALQAAAARVPYDEAHMQWVTTGASGKPALPDNEEVTYWTGNVNKLKKGEIGYREMDGMDCVALLHVAYWRGAQVDIDASWWPFHTPGQLLSHARSNNLIRAVLFEPVWREAAILGAWKASIDATVAGKPIKSEVTVWAEPQENALVLQEYDPKTNKPKGSAPVPLPLTYDAQGLPRAEIRQGGSYLVLTMSKHGAIEGYMADKDGTEMSISAKKLRFQR